MPTITSLDDAITVIETAAHLGETINAIPGTTIYLATVDTSDDYTLVFSAHTSEHAATRAIAAWVLEQSNDGEYGPWTEDATWNDINDDQEAINHIQQWLNTHTEQELITYYFDNSDDRYEIVQMTVQPDVQPTPLQWV